MAYNYCLKQTNYNNITFLSDVAVNFCSFCVTFERLCSNAETTWTCYNKKISYRTQIARKLRTQSNDSKFPTTVTRLWTPWVSPRRNHKFHRGVSHGRKNRWHLWCLWHHAIKFAVQWGARRGLLYLTPFVIIIIIIIIIYYNYETYNSDIAKLMDIPLN